MVNLHIYPSAFKFESRILKETQSVVKNNSAAKLIIASIWEHPLKMHEQLDGQRVVLRVPIFGNNKSKNKIVKGVNYLEFFIRIVIKFLFRRIDVVNCHSLTVMPLGVIFRVIKGSKLIYDTHELETERESLGGITKRLMKFLEGICIRFADSVIVVNQSIGEWYRQQYRLKNVYVVRNIPYQVRLNAENDKFRESFEIPDDSIIFLYQGYLNAGRAIDFLLDIFAHLDDSRHIVFMGYGKFQDEIERYSRTYRNIHFHPAVSMDKLPSYTASADVGISLTDKPCLSYQLSLGNKFFEFINAEIPFIFWDGFIEVNQLNDRFNFGWSVPKHYDQVTELITSLTKEAIDQKKKNVRNCKPHFDWSNEEKEISRAYEFEFQR